MCPSNDVNRCLPRFKLAIGFFVVVHLLGVLAQPLRFFSRRASGEEGPEFVWLSDWMRPYSQWLYLDHGYFFFAPNPGPGHLVQYGETSDPRSEPNSGIFPDRTSHWPRLRYHRYFMLSEFYHSRFAPTHVDEELKRDPVFMARWNFDSNVYRQLQSSIQSSLSQSTGRAIKTLIRLERTLPDPGEIHQEGLQLTNPRFLEVLPESMRNEVGATSEALPPKTESKP